VHLIITSSALTVESWQMRAALCSGKYWS